MEKIHLSVIIPAYNEEKRLASTLKEIDEYLKKQDYSSEIIVVNDGSKDATAEVVRRLTQQIQNLKLIDNKVNRGKGYVVRQGLLAGKGEFRLFTDADNSTPINQIEKMWPEFEKDYDIVIGSRDIKGAILDPPQPFHRRVLGKIFRLLTHLICGTWGIKDSQCGFKCFSERAAKDIFSRTKIDRWAFDVEVLALARRLGYKIAIIPVYWKNDPHSHVKLKAYFRVLWELIKIRINLWRNVYQI